MPWESKEWVCIDQELVWGTAITHKGMSKFLDICFSKDENNISPSGSDRLRRRTLLDQFSPKADPADIRLMTDNYIIGGEGYYMPSESFLYLRKCERMIEKITPPTPINLMDHIIIPINVRHSHWFPAHINLHNQSFSLLDSSQEYSVTSYPLQEMLIWKFLKTIWTTHVSGETPGPMGYPPGQIRQTTPKTDESHADNDSDVTNRPTHNCE